MKWVNPGQFFGFLSPWIIWKGPDRQKIYLTFDDGPHPEYTPQILQILKKENVHAAFFCQGEKAVLYPGIVSRAYTEGHVIGNHGYEHRAMWKMRKAEIIKQIQKADAALQSITGTHPVLFRPPFGNFPPGMKSIVNGLNYRLVLWSLMPFDFAETDPKIVTKRIMRHLHPGAVIVVHDGHQNAPVLIEALHEFIRLIKKKGFEFGSLDNVLEQ